MNIDSDRRSSGFQHRSVFACVPARPLSVSRGAARGRAGGLARALRHLGDGAASGGARRADATGRPIVPSAGVGLSDFRKEPPWRPPSIILEADPPLHTRTRAVLTRILSPAAINVLRERFEREAEALVDRLVEQREFDGVADLAEAYPLKVFPDAVGLPRRAAKTCCPMAAWCSTRSVRATICSTRRWPMPGRCATGSCRNAAARRWRRTGSASQIFHAVDAGELTEAEAGMLVRSFLSAGIDTTVYGLGNALYCFAALSRAMDDPARKSVADPRRIRGGAALRGAGADVLPDHNQGGRRRRRRGSGKARRCCCSLPPPIATRAAGTSPTAFDVSRRATGHMTFGTGIHGCVGQAVARLEMRGDLRRACQVASPRSS